jgi:hypothetical protein
MSDKKPPAAPEALDEKDDVMVRTSRGSVSRDEHQALHDRITALEATVQALVTKLKHWI